MRNEMAQTVDDVLARRTRARLLARDASADAADDVAALMAAELGWTDAEQRTQVEHYRALVRAEQEAGGLPAIALDALFATPVVGVYTSGRPWQTNRGAPTPPIAFAGGAAGVTAHLSAPRVEVDDALATRARGHRRRTHPRRGGRERSEPRLVAARDDLGARRPGRGARERGGATRRRRPGRRDPAGVQRRIGPGDRSRRVAAGCAARVCPSSAASSSTSRISPASSSVDATSMLVDVLPGDVRRRVRGSAARRARRHVRTLAAVDGAVDGRRLGRMPRRGSALDALREDRGHRHRASTSSSPTARTITTGGAPRAAVGPDLDQLFVGSEGTLGIIVGARLPRPSESGRRGPRRVRVRRPSPAPSTRCAASCSAARRRPCCGSTTRSRPTASTTPATRTCCSCSTRATPTSSTRRMRIVAEECAAAAPIDVALVEQWLGHRNDVSALESLVQRGFVVDTMEISGSWRALPEIYERTTEAMRAVEHTLAASAHQSHSYTDGGCLYFTFAGRPPEDERERYYRAMWDAGQRAVLAAGGALSHHHGVGLNRARFVADALGAGFDVLAAREGHARPERHPQPGQARTPVAVRRPRLAVVRCRTGPCSSSMSGRAASAPRSCAPMPPSPTRSLRSCSPTRPSDGIVQFDATAMAAAALDNRARRARRSRTRRRGRHLQPTRGRRSCGIARPVSRSARGSVGRIYAPSATASPCARSDCDSHRTSRPPS